MMPWESWNARDAAWLRIERASARTIEEEMAARWWGKKASRPRPCAVCGHPARSSPRAWEAGGLVGCSTQAHASLAFQLSHGII